MTCEHYWVLVDELRFSRMWRCDNCKKLTRVHARVKRVPGMGDVVIWPVP